MRKFKNYAFFMICFLAFNLMGLRVCFAQEASFAADVQEGEYALWVTYRIQSEETIMKPELNLTVNGERQEQKLALPVWYQVDGNYPVDRYGNETAAKAQVDPDVQEDFLRGYEQMQAELVFLQSGRNQFVISNIPEGIFIENVVPVKVAQLPSYEAYRKEAPMGTGCITIEAEKFIRKNDASIQADSLNDAGIVPENGREKKMNALGTSVNQGGQQVEWEFEVENSGNYYISLKETQKSNDKVNMPVYRTVLIDGKIPFQELQGYRIDYSGQWENMTLGETQEPYQFYLEKGKHTLALEVDHGPVQEWSDSLSKTVRELNDFVVEIKKLTGNTVDRNRDWNIKDYMVDIDTRMLAWADTIERIQKEIEAVGTAGMEPKNSARLKVAANSLKKLAETPDEIPYQLSSISEGSGSVAQTLSDVASDLVLQPLNIDRIYIHSDMQLPDPDAGFFQKCVKSIKRFFSSFTQDPYQNVTEKDEALTIWVRRGRQYVEILQQMTDTEFTPQTGIKVNFSIMPDENKIILANAAKTNPDAVIGMSTWQPFEFGIRGAAADMRQFEGFGDLIKDFSPGAFLSYMIDDACYALPETQDFSVLFYRKDILQQLGLPVPDNWEEVLSILPELQRYGMNFYSPMSVSASQKPFASTLPFIKQFGGDILNENCTGTGINSESSLNAIRFMAELHTMYSMPDQVPNFYNSFRYGQLPLGISNFSTYVQLVNSAPELAGNWGIALYPGVVDESGQVQRWATGSGSACMIFKNSEKQQEAWEFLQWYLSEDVQTDYASLLYTTLGSGYLWNSANIQAFSNSPMDEADKQVVLEQWEWIFEPVKFPGHYMVERGISNAWNETVMNGSGVREAVDDEAIKCDREIRRKMEELGYYKDGVQIKPFRMPTIEMVESWRDANEE